MGTFRPRLLVCVGLLAACTSDTPAPDTSAPPAPLPADAWTGPTADGGFGSRLAGAGAEVYAGSPFAARVDALAPDGVLGAALTGETGSFFGAGLVMVDGALAIGAPGRGEVLLAGEVVASEPGLGGVIAAQGPRWVASTPTGWRASDGSRATLGRRPDALAWLPDGAVLAGAAWGATWSWTGAAAEARAAANDERGYALVVCRGADGVDVPWSGAPGAGTVVPAGGAPVGPGTGRFGAALACGSTPGVLWVGAPAADTHAGALYRVEDGAYVRVAAGAPGDELGTAVLVTGGRVLVGSPGPAASTGRVDAWPEDELAP